MSQPAARQGDEHFCPASNGDTPHKGGKILQGEPNVLIGGKPAARIGDLAKCNAPVPDCINSGSATVLIGGKPAARMGDSTVHGGQIIQGCQSVLIG